MKLRSGFVSNSSSASFVVEKGKISNWQLDAIRDHLYYAKEFLRWEGDFDGEWWPIEEDEICIEGHTSMDNFDMLSFLKAICVPPEAYNYSDHCADDFDD